MENYLEGGSKTKATVDGIVDFTEYTCSFETKGMKFFLA